MPTTRTRRSRAAVRHVITPEIIALFLAAEATLSTYFGCVRGEGCRSTDRGRHCDDCRTYLDSSRALDAALGVGLHEVSPVDAVTAEPPAYPCHGWDRAVDLRRELGAASQKGTD